MKLWSILGNSQKLDGGAMFGNAPKAMWERWASVDGGNRIDLACRALLASPLAGKTVLFETGIGAFFEPALRERYGVQEAHHVLLESLRAAGFEHEDIDVVVLSHLHFDHAGGLLAAWEEGAPPRLLEAAEEFDIPLLPGIGTVDDLQSAADCGIHTVRVATHCTEADVSEQHIVAGRKLGLDTVGFLMMAHMNSPEGLVKQAKLMEGYGANCIYITDSAGYMLPADVKARLQAVRDALKPETELGFHGHHNLAMGIANSVAAIECGATRIDAAAAGLGAGAGNTPMEVLVAVLDRMGVSTGVDVWKIQDVAEDLVVPIMDFPIRIDRDALTLGYAGVYGSFLLFAKRAEKKYGVPARDILVELGKRKMIGGQEDMIEDTALTMAKARGLIKDQAA